MSDQKGALHLKDNNFKETLEASELPIMVDFYAEWCGPCQMAAPIVDKLAEKYKGRMLIVKVNVDDNQKTAQKYGVMSIPTIIIFKIEAGKIQEVYRKVGFPGEQGFIEMIEAQLK